MNTAYQFDVANQIGEGTYGIVFTGICRRTKDRVRFSSELDSYRFLSLSLSRLKAYSVQATRNWC